MENKIMRKKSSVIKCPLIPVDSFESERYNSSYYGEEFYLDWYLPSYDLYDYCNENHMSTLYEQTKEAN